MSKPKKKKTINSDSKSAWALKGYLRPGFRFEDVAHRDLVVRAAERAGLSMNRWLVEVTKAAAMCELKVK